MAEEVCGRPLIEPLYAFPDGLLPLHRFFSGERERFPSWIDGSVPPESEKEAGDESTKGLFLERMSQVAITTSTVKSSGGGTVAFVQKMTKGKLGNIMLLVREASTTAIEDNLSCLDEALLQQKWNNIQEKPAKEEQFHRGQSEKLVEKEEE